MLISVVALLFASKKHNQKLSTTLFLFTSLTTALWIGCLWVADTFHSINTALIMLNMAVCLMAIITTLFFIFSMVYPDGNLSNRKSLVVIAPILIFDLALIYFGINLDIVTSVELTEFGAIIKNAGTVYLLSALVANILMIAGIILLFKTRKTLGLQQKAQVKNIIIAVSIALFANIFSGTIATYIDGLNWFNYIATLSIVFFVAMVGYTIYKHQLFDIKALVARSFVYTITTTVLVTLYSAISLPIKNYLISINTETYISTIVEIVLLGIFGVSFYPLKLYFDRVTTKYFFRDHYNTQEVLRTINTILSESVDLDRMLHRVGGILRSTLHVEYCSFMIDESDGETNSVRHINIGRAIHRVTINENLEKLLKKSNVVITEELRDDDPLENEQKEQLIRQDIAAAVKLKGVDEHGHIENEGFLILGNKKSGRGFSGQDEKMLEILSGQFAVAIQNLVHLDEIVHFNIKLQEEVTDATKELKVKNKKLRELDQTKDEFVSMASHQLRTPLTSVKGYLSMVLDGDAGELKPAQKQLLDQAYISTQRMVYLIADLLNLSRLKTGKFMINPQPTNLAHMIEGEIHQIEQTARASDLKVSFMCDPSIPDLMLDDMKTRQVIMNFIDNAIYYTPKGGNIEVYLEKEDGKAIFKVSDSGIGVAKEDQKELFGKFFRAGNARKARPDGTGLGLYMAKMVIDAQGGKILFSSQEGKGSTFGFSFDIEQLKVGPNTQNIQVPPEKTP